VSGAAPIPTEVEGPPVLSVQTSIRIHVYGAESVGLSKETIEAELEHTAKLSKKNLGELAELAFMRKAASMGFAVAKPWGDSDRYDVIVSFGKMFWRVQVKSVVFTHISKHSYRFKTTGGGNSTYSADEIDFLVAYIFPKHAWYIFPATVVERRDSVCVRPESKKCRFLQYREAWDLMMEGLAAAAISRG